MNPFDGIGPDLTVFGPLFDALWKQVLAAVWGIVLIVSGIFLVLSFGKSSAATASRNPERLSEARGQMIWSGIIFTLCLLIAVIVGALVAFANQAGAEGAG